MKLRSSLGRVRQRILCSFYRRNVPLGDRGPVVSFAFDDFPRTAYLVGGAILEKFGARGTYYLTAGLMNVHNDLGELFHPEDLRSLLDEGHDLGSQTFSHSSCRRVSLATFREDVEKGQKAVEELAGHNSTNFAYPYGHVTLRSKKILGPQLTSSRGIVPGFNGPEIDLNLLRANSLYGDVDRIGWADGLLRENVRRKSWLIFYTHDVRPQPSEYGCTPDLFEWVVSSAVRSGSRILPVAQVLAEVGLARAATPSAGQEMAQVRR